MASTMGKYEFTSKKYQVWIDDRIHNRSYSICAMDLTKITVYISIQLYLLIIIYIYIYIMIFR